MAGSRQTGRRQLNLHCRSCRILLLLGSHRSSNCQRGREREPELTAMQSKFSSDCYRFCSLRTSANACTLLVFATDWSHSLGAHCTKAMELKMKKVCSKGLVHLLSLPAHYLGLHLWIAALSGWLSGASVRQTDKPATRRCCRLASIGGPVSASARMAGKSEKRVGQCHAFCTYLSHLINRTWPLSTQQT